MLRLKLLSNLQDVGDGIGSEQLKVLGCKYGTHKQRGDDLMHLLVPALEGHLGNHATLPSISHADSPLLDVLDDALRKPCAHGPTCQIRS